jgi:predicted PurR-regulated permease PerM
MADTSPQHAARTATVITAVVLVGATIWWLRGILAPFALALFLMVLIDGVARVVEHRIPHFPRRAALPVSMAMTMAAFGLAAYLVAANAPVFVSQLVAYEPRLNGLIARTAGDIGVQVPPTVEDLIAKANVPQYLAGVASGLEHFAAGAAFVFVCLLFLFFSRHGFEQKAQMLFHTEKEREHAAKVFVRIRTGVERYIWVQTLTALIIGAASWTLMRWVGLDNALFWAFLVFVAAYVPILGGAVAIFLPPIFALVQFDGYWQALVLLFGAETIHFLVGNFVAPRMQGVSLNVDPIVVLLSLAFWGVIWGVPGMFLSTPLTVVAIVVLIQFPQTHWIAVLLSRDGDPETYGRPSHDAVAP